MSHAISKPASWNERLPVHLPTLVFFGVFYFYTWLLVNPVLQTHALGNIFLFDDVFLSGFLEYPGGLVEGVAAFLTHCFHWGWLGALIETVLAALICLAMRSWLGRISQRPVWVLHLTPAFFLLLLLSRYQFPWVEASLGLLVVIAALAVYAGLRWEKAWLRFGVFLLLTAMVYWLTAALYLLFALGVGLWELVRGRRYLLALGGWLVAAAVPYLGATWFVMHVGDAYRMKSFGIDPPRSALLFLGLLLSAPGLALALFGVRGLRTLRTRWVASLLAAVAPAAAWLRFPLTPLILAALVLLLGVDPNAKRLVAISHASQQKQWLPVLREGRRLTAYTAEAVSDINRALCQQDRLLYEMFFYPQRDDFGFWLHLHETFNTKRCQKASDLLFELGQINKAERMAGEALELNGPQPETLLRLALVQVLKGQPEAARVFLRLLGKTLTHRDLAQRYLRQLDQDPRLSNDGELQRLRALAITAEYFGDVPAEQNLQQCLKRNPRNRLAFEYLMAGYLLQKNLDLVELNVSRLDAFNYPDLPRHVEEALLLQRNLVRDRPLKLGARRFQPQTEQRCAEFHRRFMASGGNMEAARADLCKDFGNTYWFFYMFGTSGKAFTAANLGL